MQNTSSINLSKFECRLINSFGDGHNHELAQYEALAKSLKQIAASRKFDGILLGNVVCDNVSLDSLLLTPFGVFIIEFKSYPKVARIRITGQKEFQCLNANGERMTQKTGSFLNVKGGSLPSPYDQAKKNRIAVFNTLKRVFGEEKARNIHVGVAIVFDSKIAIEGIGHIIESDRRWLTVVDPTGFEQFISYVSGEKGKGLTADERENLVSHMDAQEGVAEKADPLQQMAAYLKMDNFEMAYQKALLCDPYEPIIICQKLMCLFHCGNKRKYAILFDKLVAENLNNPNRKVRDLANQLMGASFLKGINGHPQSDEKALEFFEQMESTEGISNCIFSLRERIQLAQKKKEQEEAMREAMRKESERSRYFNSTNSKRIEEAGSLYLMAAHIVLTVIILIAVFHAIAAMMPSNGINWHGLAFICYLFPIGGILIWVKEKESDDVWFIRKDTFKHVKNLPFRTVSIKSDSFLKGDRLYKTFLLISASILYFGLPMYICCRIIKLSLGYLMSLDFIRNSVAEIVSRSSIDPMTTIIVCLSMFFIFNSCAIAFTLFSELFNSDNFFGTVNDGKDKCYLIAVPDLKRDIERSLDSSLLTLLKEGLIFSGILTTTLCVLGVLRPLLYTAISILF